MVAAGCDHGGDAIRKPMPRQSPLPPLPVGLEDTGWPIVVPCRAVVILSLAKIQSVPKVTCLAPLDFGA
jgi:hypothetical protein